MPTVYPCVPGHEIVGRVTKVGSKVDKYKQDDLVAVGCMVDSDHTCPRCKENFEQFCPNVTFTYNAPDPRLGIVTYGGYSDNVVVDERFVLRVPPWSPQHHCRRRGHPIQGINEAYERLLKSDVKYRFCIDILKSE